ncbi:MAG: hypothetical protein NDI61_02405 [Bdellovibrionaceae bacterium]|nr:hypothetical protein [Pseudobdellovibrionaceae bacterium]
MYSQFAITVVVVFLSQVAMAASRPFSIECAYTPYGGDEGYEVSLKTNSSGRGKAILFVIDPGGKRPVKQFSVTQTPPNPRRPGLLATFKGDDFFLQLHRDKVPGEEGVVTALISTVDENGFQIHESMYCWPRR